MSVVVPSLRPAIAVPGWAKNELWRKAKAVPSLDLRFADSKSLVDATTGQNLVTFSRASGGTYFDSQGVLRTALVNEPRFDHNPTTGESLGLLVEELRRNLLLSSAALATQTVTVAAVAHTLSFYGTGSVALSGTHVATVNGSGAYPTRTTLTFTPTAGSLTLTVTGAVQYANLEEGSFATSYIENVDTPGGVTRAADVVSITGANFSSWYNQSEGTVFCSFSRSALISSTGFANLWAISDGTASERLLAYNTGSSQTIDTVITDGGVAQGTLITPGAITANSMQAHSFAYKANDFAATRNAGTVVVDTSGTLPTVSRLYVGANHVGGGQFSGSIRRLTYWGQRLPNSVLQGITQ